MQIGVVGGGPAGLSFSVFAKSLAPHWNVSVWERDPLPDEGFGIVLPTRAVAQLADWDPVLGAAVRRCGVGWERIDVRRGGTVVSSIGHEYRALRRRGLIDALRRRCLDLGVTLHLAPARRPARLAADLDVLVGADGARSAVRGHWAPAFRPRLVSGRCRFLWMRTQIRLDAFTFHIIESPYGVIALHTYPHSPDLATVIVEMRDEVWQALNPAGTGARDTTGRPVLPPALLELLRAPLGVGPFHANGSGWQNFVSVHVDTWTTSNVALLGDAAHAAHFSIGSGTRMAIEDARTLAECLVNEPPPAALRTYERTRRPAVTALQEAAEASRTWFEDLAIQPHEDPVSFAERLLRRAGRPAGIQAQPATTDT